MAGRSRLKVLETLLLLAFVGKIAKLQMFFTLARQPANWRCDCLARKSCVNFALLREAIRVSRRGF